MHVQVAIAVVINRTQSIVAIKIKKGGKMYSLILNSCVYVRSFGPYDCYETTELSGQL